MHVLWSTIPARVLKLFHHTIHPPARKKQHLSSSALHDTAAETAWRNLVHPTASTPISSHDSVGQEC
jgi:hypothetical protein